MKIDIAPMATAAEFDVLADEYLAGLNKMMASGYEEFGDEVLRRHRMVIVALRAAAALRTLAELPVTSGDRK